MRSNASELIRVLRVVAITMAFLLGVAQRAHADAAPEDELEELDEMLADQPTSVNLLLERSVVLGEMRRFAEAMASIDRAEAISGQDSRIPVFRARLEMARGRADVARASIDLHLRRFPDDRAALLLHAAACEALDDVDGAIDDLRAALVVRYDDALALRIAGLLRARGRRDDAERLILDAAARQPAHPAIVVEAIEVLRHRREFAAALTLVDRLAVGAAVPTRMELLRGEILRQSGRRAESLSAFRRALALANQTLSRRISAAALVERARARMGLSDFEDARVDLDAARSIAPRMPEIAQLIEAANARRNVP